MIEPRHLDRLLLIRRVSPYVEVPRCYGLAWQDYHRDKNVCAPLGLNKLYGWANMAYWYARRPSRLFKRRQEIEQLKGEIEYLKRKLKEAEGERWLIG